MELAGLNQKDDARSGMRKCLGWETRGWRRGGRARSDGGR